jgi:hypothetical protein
MIILSLSFSNVLFSQVEDEAPTESMTVKESAEEESSPIMYTQGIGLKTGYYTTVALSYNLSFSEHSALDVNFGYRIPGGWLGNGDNTRLGGVVAYQYHYFLNNNPERLWSLFGTAGIHLAQADYTDRGGLRDYGETFLTSGVTFGLGLSVRWGRVNIDGALMPAYDFLNPEYGGGDFYWLRCSNVSLRYMF